MAQALYRKWRPARFDQVVGQEHVTRTLRNAIASGRSGHAYLFCGPRGTGKTTTARLLAKAVNCLHDQLEERPCNECANCRAIGEGRFLDLIEIDAASNTGVDDIRDLRDKINFAPSEGRFKVYIIDEVHMLSTAAFNALLKTLEEPPPHAKFVLATTEEHKVPMTIKSRCQQFNFRLLTLQEISARLKWMAEKESLSLEPEALNLIARHGAGSIRDAESLLDQLVAGPEDAITLERTQMVLGTASVEAVSALTDAWLAGDAPRGLNLIHEALGSGADARQFARQMVDHLRQVLLLQAAGTAITLDVPAEEQAQMTAQAASSSREQLIEAIKAFNQAALSASSSWQPQLPLELAFIQLLPEGAPAVVLPRSGAQPDQVTAQAPPSEARESSKSQAQPAEREAAEPEETGNGPEPGVEEEAEPDKPAAPAAHESAEPVVADPAGAEKPAAPSVAPGGAMNLDAVKANWASMVSRIRREDKNLPALLNVCKPLAIEGSTIILGFDYPMLKDKFEDKREARQQVAEILSELLGQKCSVRSVVTSHYTPPPPAPTAGDSDVKEEFYALAEELGGQVRET